MFHALQKHIVLNLCSIALICAYEVKLRAYVSQHGLHGRIDIVQKPNRTEIFTNLDATLQYPEQTWSWTVNEFPVDYTQVTRDRCADAQLGRVLIDLNAKFDNLILPEHGHKLIELGEELDLYGKSIVFRAIDSDLRVCASIIAVDKTIEKVAVAKFATPIFGEIIFRWIAVSDTYVSNKVNIIADLYHVALNFTKITRFTPGATKHKWKIFTTDILENNKNANDVINCNSLQISFNPGNRAPGLAMGDIDERVGNISIATDYRRRAYRILFNDPLLFLTPSDIQGAKRHLYIVIYDDKHRDNYLACAKLRSHASINDRAMFRHRGVTGDVFFSQYSKFDPTMVNFTLNPDNEVTDALIDRYVINTLPMYPPTSLKDVENTCVDTGGMFNPSNVDVSGSPPAGYGTQDQYAIGDLTGKYLNFKGNGSEEATVKRKLAGQFWDVFLPLSGFNSISLRSMSMYGYDSSDAPWVCANLAMYDATFQYQVQMFTARVLFRYPIVGSILFRQPRDDYHADTTILIEKLVHADGKQVNNTESHRWAVHQSAPGKDFYDWQRRCTSSGNITNTFNVYVDETAPDERCTLQTIGHCRVGDLSPRLGLLNIAGKNAESKKIARKIFIDTNTPLTGPNRILGRAIVIYDDHGPVARGDRLACAKVEGVYRRKGVVKDWFPNGDPLTAKGKIEFLQQTEYDVTNIDVDLMGLNDNSGYHIHMTPVEADLEFPCEHSSLYDYWNPLEIGAEKVHTTNKSSAISHEEKYEMGDLSGKFGRLDARKSYKASFNDTMMPLFGVRSVIGRSVVIHKRTNKRWVCATIERGYSPSDAREIRAIASFHHPDGFAYGYVRMTQLVHQDDSKSDTIIEVKLRHPGKHDRNVTRNHNWAVFVNPVGVDAVVKTYATRCVAGGYVWNPFYTQLADPLNEDLYRQECSSDNPLRCYVGDISGRLGPIDLGAERKVFTDSNLPLEGVVTAVGKSIVIYSPNFGSEKFACANIEPDHDIVKFVNVEKPPRFVLAQFIDDARNVMGAPEWMLAVDSRKTKVLHGGSCIQLLVHFKGPLARSLELDFTRLLANGRLDSPTLKIPGYFNSKRKSVIHYRQCGSVDVAEKDSYYSTTRLHNGNVCVVPSFMIVTTFCSLVIFNFLF